MCVGSAGSSRRALVSDRQPDRSQWARDGLETVGSALGCLWYMFAMGFLFAGAGFTIRFLQHGDPADLGIAAASLGVLAVGHRILER